MWSSFYEHYDRRPDQTLFLPNYVAMQYKWDGPGDAPIGWGGQAPASLFVDDVKLMEPYIAHLSKEVGNEDLTKLGGDFRVLSAGDLASMIERAAHGAGHRVWVFDVRPALDFAGGHIAEAISAPCHDFRLIFYMTPKSRRWAFVERLTDPEAVKVIYDSTGKEEGDRSMRFFRRISSAHSIKFMRLQGGLDAWRAAGLQVVCKLDEGLPSASGHSTGSNIWEVVGGGDSGGILVRSGRELSSAKLEARLCKGSRVRELERVGDRLHYEIISGMGPTSGWVSVRLNHKDLLAPLGIPVGKRAGG